MKTIAEISNALRSTLIHSGRTQESVREDAGLSRQTAVNVFKGTEDFKLSTLLAVADKLGLEVALIPRGTSRAVEGQGAPVVETKVQRALHGSHQIGKVNLERMFEKASTGSTESRAHKSTSKAKP